MEARTGIHSEASYVENQELQSRSERQDVNERVLEVRASRVPLRGLGCDRRGGSGAYEVVATRVGLSRDSSVGSVGSKGETDSVYEDTPLAEEGPIIASSLVGFGLFECLEGGSRLGYVQVSFLRKQFAHTGACASHYTPVNQLFDS